MATNEHTEAWASVMAIILIVALFALGWVKPILAWIGGAFLKWIW